MAHENRRKASGLYIDDRPLGEYLVDIDIAFFEDGTVGEPIRIALDLVEAQRIRLAIDNAIDALRNRQRVDLVCGDCVTCGNTRMTTIKRPSRKDPEAIHCPVCHPKIIEMQQKLGRGAL